MEKFKSFSNVDIITKGDNLLNFMEFNKLISDIIPVDDEDITG